MHQPMTPIELIVSAISLTCTFALFWWGMRHLINGAVELYARCRPMREKNQEGK